MTNRVVATGLGPVSSIGIGVKAFESALRAGQSGISRITCFDPDMYPQVNGGEVHDFRPDDWLRYLKPDEWGRASQLAAAAARLAVDDADLMVESVPPDRIGAVVGTTAGESQAVLALSHNLVTTGFTHARDSAGLLRQIPTERLAHAVSVELGAAGESVTLGTACSASNYAIGYAYDILSRGDAEVMLAGGADSMSRYVHAGFLRLGALTESTCAPFDGNRSGILVGEGCAMLLLETLEHARERGACAYAEVLGYGLTCDASHPVAPSVHAIAECMRVAQRNAGVEPDDVDYICAHGTGTPTNDQVEFQAIREVFGDRRLPPTSSIKSMLGHTMGAASGFGAIASALAIAEGFLPPTINFSTPDPDLAGLDIVPNSARGTDVRVAQNNGFAFGGNNAIVIFGRAE